MIGVYVITHVATGRQYVGKSIDVQKRIEEHFIARRGIKTVSIIRLAISKYGRDAFTSIVVEDCVDDATALHRETLWIRELNSRSPNGFNLTAGGEGRSGLKHSPETRAKMSAALIGNKRGAGHVISPENRAKLTAAIRREPRSVESREKNAIAHLGRTHSEASLAKMRARKPTDETRVRLSAARVGKRHTEVTRARMRAAWLNRRLAKDGVSNA